MTKRDEFHLVGFRGMCNTGGGVDCLVRGITAQAIHSGGGVVRTGTARTRTAQALQPNTGSDSPERFTFAVSDFDQVGLPEQNETIQSEGLSYAIETLNVSGPLIICGCGKGVVL